jgi:hypothetical protein
VDVRRLAEFLRRILQTAMPKAVDAATGTMPPALTFALGAVGTTLGLYVLGPSSPWPFWIGLATVLLVAGEAAYLEWDRWAPHDPLRAELDLSGEPQIVALVVKNRDVPGYLRLSITDARCGDTDVGNGLPWLMVWDTGNTERHVLRGESARIVLVRLDPNAVREIASEKAHRPAFTFSRTGMQASVSGPDRPGRLSVLLTFSLFRVEPPTRGIDRSVLITFPSAVASAQAEWVK